MSALKHLQRQIEDTTNEKWRYWVALKKIAAGTPNARHIARQALGEE